MDKLTHFDSDGRLAQVDVGKKSPSSRRAIARGEIRIKPKVIQALASQRLAKGDALACAKIAGIFAAKKTAELIPLCHPLNLDWVDVTFQIRRDRVEVSALAEAFGKTGVEMEALTVVSVACLTLYDMLKSMDKTMTIGPIYLLEKKGGRSGHYDRAGVPAQRDCEEMVEARQSVNRVRGKLCG